MSPIEQKRLQVEYKQVNAAREQMEYKILEYQENIDRLEDNIVIQKAREEELLLKIKESVK